MIALLDADGVLVDFVGGLVRELGTGCPPFDAFHTYKLSDTLGPELWPTAERIMRDPDFWASLPPVPGARESVGALRSAGYEVVVATAPWRSCNRWEFARRKLLKQLFDISPDDVIICSAERKATIRATVFIDDKPETVWDWLMESGCTGLLFSAPWNAGESRIPRRTWPEILDYLEVKR